MSSYPSLTQTHTPVDATPPAALAKHLPTPPSKPLRIGVIGVGFIAQRCHLPALAMLQSMGWPVEITALCDRNLERLDPSVIALPQASRFDEAETLLSNHNFDALMVFTWPPTTHQITEAAIQRGIPVLVEKPVAHDAKTLERLHMFSLQQRVPVQVAYNRRHQALAGLFTREIKHLSEVRQIRARLLRAERSEPMFFEDVTVHLLDFLDAQFGPLKVAHAQWDVGDSVKTLPAGLTANLISADEVSIDIDVRPAVGRVLERVEVIGNGSSVQLDYPPLLREGNYSALTVFRSDLKDGVSYTSTQGQSVLYACGFLKQMASFLSLAAGDTPQATPSLIDAAAVWRLFEDLRSAHWH